MIVAFVAMVAAYFVAVVNRNFIKASMPWTEEVAMYSMIYMALLGTEVGLRDGTQVAVTAIIEKLHRTTKKSDLHFKRFREKLCHDFIHHRSFYRFFLGIYLLRRFPGTGKRSYQHAFKFRAVLLRSCHYPADLRYIHGRNCYRCSFSTGPLAYCPEYGY